MLAPHRGRRLLLPSFALMALVAITCRSTAYFDLDHKGAAALGQGAGPSTITFAALTALNLTAHPLMQAQGLEVTDVTQATLTRASLSIDTPATGTDLSFLAAVDVVLTADGMQPLTVAHGTGFAAGTNLVPLALQQTQITAYLKGKHPTFTLRPTFAAAVPQDLTLGMSLVTQVRVGEPGGSCQN